MSAAGSLWIVATPIGTLEDLGPRARDILADADVLLAEDTRRTRALLTSAGIPAGRRLRSLHTHNEQRATAGALAELERGRRVALVSDAGTPVLSDPGFELVREARRRGLPVHSVPGPSAFTAALAASGQPPLPAVLVGFLPPQAGARRSRAGELARLPGTLVVLLSPHRLAAELANLADALGGERPATLLAELSKAHERAEMATLGELAGRPEVRQPRGEYVVVIGPAPERKAGPVDPGAARAAYEEALGAGMERGDALRAAARRLGVSRRALYQLLLEDETTPGG